MPPQIFVSFIYSTPLMVVPDMKWAVQYSKFCDSHLLNEFILILSLFSSPGENQHIMIALIIIIMPFI